MTRSKIKDKSEKVMYDVFIRAMKFGKTYLISQVACKEISEMIKEKI